MRRAALGAVTWAVALAFAPGGAPAQDSVRDRPAQRVLSDSALDAQTAAVAATLRCPVCQGESVQDSPAELAQQMRAVVRERLRSGETPDQVRAYFMSKYGEWILLQPRMTGLNVALYALPVALVIGGLALVAVLVRRWTAAGPADTEAPQP